MKAGRERRPLKRARRLADDDGDKGEVVQSVDRAMAILDALGEDEEGYRLRDLAIRTGLSPSTVHRDSE